MLTTIEVNQHGDITPPIAPSALQILFVAAELDMSVPNVYPVVPVHLRVASLCTSVPNVERIPKEKK